MTDRKDKIETFFKAAFCVDGKVEELDDNEIPNFKINGVIKLVDSQRGIFYVAQVIRIGDKP